MPSKQHRREILELRVANQKLETINLLMVPIVARSIELLQAREQEAMSEIVAKLLIVTQDYVDFLTSQPELH